VAAKTRRNAKDTFMMEVPEIERATPKELKSRPPSTGIEVTMAEQVRSSSTSSKGREGDDEFVKRDEFGKKKTRKENPKINIEHKIPERVLIKK
jgi:hypothetical protein